MFRNSLRRHAIDQVVAVAMDPHTDPATRATLMHHVLDTASGSSASTSTVNAGSSNIIKAETGRAYVDTTETGSVAPRQMGAGGGLTTYRRLRNGIVVGLLIFFGGAIYLIIRQSSYSETSGTEWYAGDTALLGLIAIMAAVVTAAFAYPTFKEWKDQISGPTPTVTVRYEIDGNFKDLPREAELIQNWPKEHFPVLQVKIDNSSGKVPLRDGRLGIYVQHPDEGDHAPPIVDLKPRDGNTSKFERISHVHSQEEPTVPATLLSAECPCPPRSTSYFEERFGIHEPDDVYLRFVLTGSNLRVPRTQRYKVHLSPTPGDSSRAG